MEFNGIYRNCYNTGTITGNGRLIGGISGIFENTMRSEVKNCYNTGIISSMAETNNKVRKYCRNR